MTWANSSSPRRGFTLIEIIVVVVLLSLITLVAVGRLDGLIPKYRLRSAVRGVGFVATQARAEALASGRDVYLVYDLDEKRVYAMAPAPPESDEEEPRELSTESRHVRYARMYEYELPEGVEILSVVLNRNDVRAHGRAVVRLSPFGAQPTHGVNLQDEEKRTMALKWNGLTGVATYFNRELSGSDLKHEED